MRFNTLLSAWKPLLSILLVFLASLCFWVVSSGPVQAATVPSTSLLSLKDLPLGFMQASSEETESCQMSEATAFVLKQNNQLVELICVSSFSLAAATENLEQTEAVRKIYDTILQHPEVFVQQAEAMGVDNVQILENLQDIGEVATGFSKAEADIGQTEVALFRRQNAISSILIRYEIGHEPIFPLKTIARKVDRQIIAALQIEAPKTEALKEDLKEDLKAEELNP